MVSRTTKSWTGVVLVAFVMLATVSLGAQQGAARLSAERSWAVQNQLKTIDSNRAAFVDNLLREWASYVDPYLYDLEALRPIAMKVPAWQLYGASLVGNFSTMLRVLRGFEGAGPYINAFAAPQAKAAFVPALSTSDPGASDLGSHTQQLVYTPIPPCRMVDTRLSGARTGILAAGTQRSFDLSAVGLAKGQGSAASCSAIPTINYAAWAVNIAVTGQSGNGWLVAWPYGGAEPNASVLNYGPGIWAIASGQTLVGCDGCADSVNLKAYYADTHVIIDVVGYYSWPTATASAVTSIAGTDTIVSPGGYNFIIGGQCPGGTVLVGGELDEVTDYYTGAIVQSLQTPTAFWYYVVRNSGASTITMRAYTWCMDAPVRVW